MNLASNVEIRRVMNSVAAGVTEQVSSAVDTQGYDGCLFVAHFGAITATAVTSVKAQQSSDDAATDAYADLAGTSISVPDSDSNKMVLLDVYRPQERYLKCAIERATANAVIDAVDAILYNGDVQPTVQGSTVSGTEIHVSPAEGTA